MSDIPEPELFPSPPPKGRIHIDSIPKEIRPYFIGRELVRKSDELWDQPAGAKPLKLELEADDGSIEKVIDLSPDRRSRLPGYAPAGIRGGDHDWIVIFKWRLWKLTDAGNKHSKMPPKRVIIAFLRQDTLARPEIPRDVIEELSKGHLTYRVLLDLMSEKERREILKRGEKEGSEEWAPEAGALVRDGIGGSDPSDHRDDDDDDDKAAPLSGQPAPPAQPKEKRAKDKHRNPLINQPPVSAEEHPAQVAAAQTAVGRHSSRTRSSTCRRARTTKG